MPVIFSETPVSATWNGRVYNGTYCLKGDRLHVSSAYGSKDIPKGRRKGGLKEAARDVLAGIIKERDR